MNFLEIAICAVIACLVFLLTYSIYAEVEAEKITLTKKDWTCTDYDMRTTLIATSNGAGGTIMVPTVTNVCTRYIRR